MTGKMSLVEEIAYFWICFFLASEKDNLECNPHFKKIIIKKKKKSRETHQVCTKEIHMVCWHTTLSSTKKSPIVSILHRATLTDSSAVSKADTVSRRGKIFIYFFKGERGHGDGRTQDIYWYSQVLQCSSRCPSVRVRYCLDINHYCHEAQEISTRVSPAAFSPLSFKPAWSVPVRVCVCVHMCMRVHRRVLLGQMKWFGVKWPWVILND